MSKQTILEWTVPLLASLTVLSAFILSNFSPFEITLSVSKAAESQSGLRLTDTVTPTVHILSYEPFIMHIQDFISPSEREYLVEHSKPLLERSPVGEDYEISESRTSSTAFLNKKDPIVARIAQRASEFQGYLDVEDLQITSYQPGQQYKRHVDWLGYSDPTLRTDRLTTFFAILESDCSNCGTEFPNVPWNNRDPRLCEFVDCTKDVLTSKNIPGSAVWWRNLDSWGEGRDDTLHAGLPALNGTKVGLNIWTEVDVTSRPSYRERDGHELK